jgi:hypothetical protein
MRKSLPEQTNEQVQQRVAASSPNPIERRGRVFLHQRVRTTPVAWLGHTQLTQDEWEQYGTRLGAVSKSTNWWLGDWLRFGQRHYNDHRYEFGTRITGYDEQTLMNFAYVASRFEISRRREILSWSHHAELAALNQTEQDLWLDEAAAHHFTVRQLRTQVRRTQRVGSESEPLEASVKTHLANQPAEGLSVVCLDCGHMTIVSMESIALFLQGSSTNPAPLD